LFKYIICEKWRNLRVSPGCNRLNPLAGRIVGDVNMEVELTDHLFEWLLAEWAGFGDNPAEAFPHLKDIDSYVIEDELYQAIQKAQLKKQAI
ncbi:MAG: hypothetical protein JW860_09585, partial [Sedimentisphaerales bacterium]|nr:hypothetical protein [Sedimentisphaerales bacterium]